MLVKWHEYERAQIQKSHEGRANTLCQDFMDGPYSSDSLDGRNPSFALASVVAENVLLPFTVLRLGCC